MTTSFANLKSIFRLASVPVNRLWAWLTRPAAELEETGAQRRAQLLAAFSLVSSLFIGIGALSSIAANSGIDDSTFALLTIASSSLFAYVLSRTRHFTIGAWLITWSYALTGYVLAFYSDTPVISLFSMIPLAYALSSALLPVPVLSLLVVLSNLGIFLMPVISPGVFTGIEAGTVAGNLIVLGVVLSIVTGYREMVERLRLSEISKANRELRDLNEQLDRRVSDRTRELVLAGDVGRTLTQNLELDQLLRNAVEKIRSTFELYYVQIYLYYPSQRSLVLRAGSGKSGVELLRRGHRLPLDRASLNGTAASQRQVVLVEDVSDSNNFRRNPLLPDTRSEVAMPLLIGDRLLGVLDLQSNYPNAFQPENLSAMGAIAGQLAIAIDNAQLFAQVQEARLEVENRARAQTRQDWTDFLDGIHRNELIGYRYQHGEIDLLDVDTAQIEQQGGMRVPILISGEPVGALTFAAQPGNEWSSEQVELVEGVALQAARQIENLRLLAQADRYRLEAEETARLLTRQGWDQYQKDLQNQLGYVYDQAQVHPDAASSPADDAEVAVSQPLMVHNTPIGALELAGDRPMNDEDLALIQTVAESLSAHIDSLRLNAQTQVALSNMEALNEVTRAASQTLELDLVLDEILDRILAVSGFGSGLISIEELETKKLRMVVHRNLPEAMVAKLTAFGLDGTPCDVVYRSGDTVILSDLERLPENLRATNLEDSFVRQAMQRPLAMGFHSYFGLALVAKGRVMGTICLFDHGNMTVNPARLSLLDAIGKQVGILVDNARLFQSTQAALSRTESLYQAIAEMNQAGSYEEVLTAVAKHTVLGRADQMLMMAVLDRPMGEGQKPEWIYPVAWSSLKPVQVARRYPAAMMSGGMMGDLNEKGISEIGGLDSRSPMMQAVQGLFTLDQPVASISGMPLTLGGQVIGFVIGLFSQKIEVDAEEFSQMKAVAGQAAIAVESRLLLEQAQAKARQEQRLREVSANVFAASNVDTILRRAVEQVGRTLGAPAYIFLGDGDRPKDGLSDNGARTGEEALDEPEGVQL